MVVLVELEFHYHDEIQHGAPDLSTNLNINLVHFVQYTLYVS